MVSSGGRSVSERGFSLIELVAAMAVFAILALMTQQALMFALASDQKIDAHRTRLMNLQRGMDGLVQDLRNVAPYPSRNASGDEPLVSLNAEQGLRFTRGGLSEPFDGERSRLARLSLSHASLEKAIVRVKQDAMASNGTPTRRLILDGEVTALRFRLYHAELGWQSQWPVDANHQNLPDGVEFVMETVHFGTVRRVVSLR